MAGTSCCYDWRRIKIPLEENMYSSRHLAAVAVVLSSFVSGLAQAALDGPPTVPVLEVRGIT